MTEPGKKPPTIWHELVQRRVVRVALYYGAAAWLLVQIADVVLEAFAADAALRYFIAAAVVGFPVALVLSWMFDLTPAGIVRTPSAEANAIAARSIAVLPFTNLSDDVENEYFSDGLADEIRDRIAQVPGVRVAARSSSFAFKGKVVDARDIGRQLSVGLLLEGGVRKFRDTLRISAQLVDTRRGYQVWSQSFDRRLEDVFAVQSEIAHSILDAVHVRMLDSPAADARTEDFAAYNLYLLGRYHFHKRTEASLQRAVKYFRDAIERDPDYGLAYSGLADATCLLGTGFYGNLSAEESLDVALPAAHRALEIAPRSAEAHASIGLILQLQRDLDGAAAALERAIELNPNYALAYVWLGLVLMSQGRYRDAEKRDLEALRLDPLSPIVNANTAFDALRFGRRDAAEAGFRSVLELDPTFPVAYSGMARVRLIQAKLDEAFDWQEKAIERAPTVAYYLARKGFIILQSGHPEQARPWFEAARRSSLDKHYLGDIFVGVAAAEQDYEGLRRILDSDDAFDSPHRALAALLLGDAGTALALYRRQCPDPVSVLHDIINYDILWRIPHTNYRAMLELREGNAGASADLNLLLELVSDFSAQGIVNADLHYWAATSCAVLGRADDAISELEKAAALGWLSTWWARRDPCLEPLRGDERFESILRNIGAAVSRFSFVGAGVARESDGPR